MNMCINIPLLFNCLKKLNFQGWENLFLLKSFVLFRKEVIEFYENL